MDSSYQYRNTRLVRESAQDVRHNTALRQVDVADFQHLEFLHPGRCAQGHRVARTRFEQSAGDGLDPAHPSAQIADFVRMKTYPYEISDLV